MTPPDDPTGDQPRRGRGRPRLYPVGASDAEKRAIRAKTVKEGRIGPAPSVVPNPHPPIDKALGKARKAKNRFAAYVPSDEHRAAVVAIVLAGLTVADAVSVIGISEYQIRRHYGHELKNAERHSIAKVARALYATACDRKHSGHVTAATFIMRSRGKWTDESTQKLLDEIEELKEQAAEDNARILRLMKARAA